MATSLEEQFAVLSHRVALDFDTPSCSGSKRRKAEKNQMVQVEKHMRVCLGVKEGFETIVTVAASEPILVEAAATVMQHKDFSSCRALREILKWPGMSKGDRGELIVANITIDTLDGLAFKDGNLSSFVIKTTSYFEALFAQNIYKDKIQNAMPSTLRDDSDNKTFGETFKDSYVYVTHFIKVYDYSVLTDRYIMALAARGVAILCADNQAGVDMILPMVYEDSVLRRTNITVIMIQSKNNSNFSTTPHRYLFDLMNPFTLGTFNKQDDNPRPVIRMVYALAARKPIVQVLERGRPTPERAAKDKGKGKDKDNGKSEDNGKGKGKSQGQSSIRSFTSFDIWCGHTSSSTFGAIRPEDNETYRELLKRSKDVVEMFEPEQQSMREVTMSMYPGATSNNAHWRSFFDLTGVANAAPLDDKDSGDEWKQSIGLSDIVSTIQSSSYVNTGGYASSPNPESAAPVFHQYSSSTSGPSFADIRGAAMRVEPAGLPVICERNSNSNKFLQARPSPTTAVLRYVRQVWSNTPPAPKWTLPVCQLSANEILMLINFCRPVFHRQPRCHDMFGKSGETRLQLQSGTRWFAHLFATEILVPTLFSQACPSTTAALGVRNG